MANEGLKSSWYNQLETANLLGAHEDQILSQGWTVVNGTRTLPGMLVWTGEKRPGSHYAAGPREQYEEQWRKLHATVLMPITNATILESVSSYVASHGLIKRGEKASAAVDRLGGVPHLAAQLGLPWFDTATLDLEVVALRERVSQLIETTTVEVQAAVARGEQKPLIVAFDLHAVSESAVRKVVSEFTGLGWKVEVDPPNAKKRCWSMQRA